MRRHELLGYELPAGPYTFIAAVDGPAPARPPSLLNQPYRDIYILV